MSLPQKRTTVDDKAYELAKKLVSDVVSKLAKKAISYTGASPAGGVIGKVYGEYAKLFFDLYLSAARSDKYWFEFRALGTALNEHVNQTAALIKDTPVPELPGVSLGFLVGALLAPEDARRFIKQQSELKTEIKRVVEHLDGMIRTFAILDKYSSGLVARSKQLLEGAPNRNVFDKVFTHGSIGSEIEGLCVASEFLATDSNRLCSHRNAWATLIGLPERRAGNHRALQRICEEVKF